MTRLIYQKWISRTDLIANPDCLYVFGDNTKRIGLGGQAAAMRGELNAHGIATLWAPGVFFSDHEYDEAKAIIDADLADLVRKTAPSGIGTEEYRTLVFPTDGIGTGLAAMNVYCPRIRAYLDKQLMAMFGITNGLFEPR